MLKYFEVSVYILALFFSAILAWKSSYDLNFLKTTIGVTGFAIISLAISFGLFRAINNLNEFICRVVFSLVAVILARVVVTVYGYPNDYILPILAALYTNFLITLFFKSKSE